MKKQTDAFLDDAVVGLGKMSKQAQAELEEKANLVQKMARGRLARKNTQKLRLEKGGDAGFRASTFVKGIVDDVVDGDKKPNPALAAGLRVIAPYIERCMACLKPLGVGPAAGNNDGGYISILSDGPKENFRASGFTRGAIGAGIDAAEQKDNFRASGFTRGAIGAGVEATQPPKEKFRATGFVRGAIGAGVDAHKPEEPIARKTSENFRATGFVRGAIGAGLDAHEHEPPSPPKPPIAKTSSEFHVSGFVAEAVGAGVDAHHSA